MRLILPNREGSWVTSKPSRVQCSECRARALFHFICRPENDMWMVGMNCECGSQEWRLCTDEEVMRLGETLGGWTTAEELASDDRS